LNCDDHGAVRDAVFIVTNSTFDYNLLIYNNILSIRLWRRIPGCSVSEAKMLMA